VTARILAFRPGPGEGRHGRIPHVTLPVSPVGDGREWPGDEKAVARFLGGDPTGFEQIVRHYSGMVFGLAARLVGPWEAEEVVQETFLRAWRGLESFRGDASLKTWLYTIALNRAKARQGTLARMRKVFASPSANAEDDGPWPGEEAPDPSASPEDQAVALEQRALLRKAIRNLPEEFRRAVVLRDLEGLAYEDIARVLNVPIGTVRSRIARGRAALLEELS
jgi:RNA polymerase sigma-70 factor (ECF subfamily)